MAGKRKKSEESEGEGAEHKVFDGDDGEDGKSTSGKSGAYSAMMLLAVVIGKVCSCKLCKSKCNEASPLPNADDEDKYGGWRPWAFYRRNVDNESKRPIGRYCLICLNVFRARGGTRRCC